MLAIILVLIVSVMAVSCKPAGSMLALPDVAGLWHMLAPFIAPQG
jgi:hypothetical protein